jgi:CRISPR-associated exonuclease Cas4
MNSDEYLQMSGIQHFCFCRRQWALAYLEQQWQENLRTTEGHLLHENCHDESFAETRGDRYIVRGMRVVSDKLKLSGSCDVVEFCVCAEGVEIEGHPGKWKPVPVEYKHGHAKESDADKLQLCAEGMALEEMLVCTVEKGYLFYAETRRREAVDFPPELRQKTIAMAAEMDSYFQRGYTPRVKPGKFCNACSLKELCLPKLCTRLNVAAYIRAHLEEEA